LPVVAPTFGFASATVMPAFPMPMPMPRWQRRRRSGGLVEEREGLLGPPSELVPCAGDRQPGVAQELGELLGGRDGVGRVAGPRQDQRRDSDRPHRVPRRQVGGTGTSEDPAEARRVRAQGVAFVGGGDVVPTGERVGNRAVLRRGRHGLDALGLDQTGELAPHVGLGRPGLPRRRRDHEDERRDPFRRLDGGVERGVRP
jgi:hypothetical protein